MIENTSKFTSRQRLRAGFLHQTLDRIAMWDSYWGETLERWHNEGLPRGVDVTEFFGLDRISGHGCDYSYRLPTKVIEDTDEYVIDLNGMGMVQKHLKGVAGAPLLIDYLIKSKSDWEKYKPLIDVSTAVERVPLNQLELNKSITDRGDFVAMWLPDPIWCFFFSCSLKEALVIMLEDPKWAREIVDTFTELIVAYLDEMVKAGFYIDGILVYGDIAYNGGPFFSPKAFEQVLMPTYKRLFGYAKEQGWAGMLHSDGDIRLLLPQICECNIDALHPFDSKAGMDVRELKPLFGDKLTFVGNISKDVMATTKERIEEEVATKITVAKKGGGYIYHSDHSVPPSVSLENYLFVLECVRKYGSYANHS
jgi:uroporphyrinogen decarboxylase